ncbi:hypothetical protein DSTSK_01110 [Desulforhabdus sp. TSK]|nr:hypothetical protein DSTSK_01110 [Desulforhabdus sp. TSK]
MEFPMESSHRFTPIKHILRFSSKQCKSAMFTME